MKFTILVDSSLVIITMSLLHCRYGVKHEVTNPYYIINVSSLCPGVENILKEIMHFHYMTYMATP